MDLDNITSLMVNKLNYSIFSLSQYTNTGILNRLNEFQLCSIATLSIQIDIYIYIIAIFNLIYHSIHQ